MDDTELIARLREAFHQESEERLASIAESLIQLEKPEGKNSDSLQTVYRDFHSLKGAARSVDYLQIEGLCQVSESLLSAIIEKKSPLNKDVFNLLHQTIQLLENLISSPKSEQDKALCEELQQLKDALRTQLDNPPSGSPKKPKVQETPKESSHTHPSQNNVEEKKEADPEKGNPRAQVKASGSFQAPKLGTTVRLSTQQLDNFLLKAEELIQLKLSRLNDYNKLKELPEELLLLNKLAQSNRENLKFLELKIRQAKNSALENQISGIQETQESLKNTLEQLSQKINRLIRNQADGVVQTDQLVNDLLETIKVAAVSPAKKLSQILERTIRDISNKTEKKIKVHISGEDVTLDRRILEELQSPLIHIARNSIDHGIESKDKRLLASKSEEGHIHISFEKEEDFVHIRVKDDGQGIDYEKIKEIAIQKNLIKESETPDERQLNRLMFHSGFSTNSIITEISGRGLGLCIVKEHIENLGGRIHIRSQRGKGSEFTFILPITLSTIRGLVFNLGNMAYAIPLSHVEQTRRIQKDEIKTIENKATINMNGKAIATVGLAPILNVPSKGSKDIFHVIILRSDDRYLGIIVDDILGVQEMLLKPLGSQLQRVRNISAVTILGDGTITPVVNPNDLFKAISQVNIPLSDPQEIEHPENTVKSLLVVEDSITSRILLKNVLESSGYNVDTAIDGQEGLTQASLSPYDLIVSDVEMPRMDGYTLTEHIKNDPSLKHTPVILVTSLGSQKDIERGVDVGADAYIVKSQFDQSVLLETIERLI